MKTIGFSSGGTDHEGNVDRMVKAILERAGNEAEFVKLTDLNFTGCKGCVRLCAGPLVCGLKDDLFPYYRQLPGADAVILGTPIYFGTINGIINSFIERFFGYRHVDIAIEGKPFVLVLTGHRLGDAEEHFRRALRPFRVEIVDVVIFQCRNYPCLWCRRHNECRIGGLYNYLGDSALELEVTPEHFRRWEDDPAMVEAVDKAAERIRASL